MYFTEFDAAGNPIYSWTLMDGIMDGLTGAGFHIENPNAARTCGCGTSFEAARPA